VSAHFGERFLTANQFLDYAYTLRILDNQHNRGLLEFLDKEGILQPVCELDIPPEVVRARFEELHPESKDPALPITAAEDVQEAAHELLLALDLGMWLTNGTDHPLERPEERHEPFIRWRKAHPYAPWSRLRVPIGRGHHGPLYVDKALDWIFYRHWQVLVFASALNMHAVSYCNLLDRDVVKDAYRGEVPRDRRRSSIRITGAHAVQRHKRQESAWEGLSAFLYERQRVLQGAGWTTDAEGFNRIEGTALEALVRNEATAAITTWSNAGLTSESSIAFIRMLCASWTEWRQLDRSLLMAEHKRNIAQAVQWHQMATGESLESVTASVGRATEDFTPALDIIFPDWLKEQRAVTSSFLTKSLKEDEPSWTTVAATALSDVDEFLDWLEAASLLSVYWHLDTAKELWLRTDPEALAGFDRELRSFGSTCEQVINALDSGDPKQLRLKVTCIWLAVPKVEGALGKHRDIATKPFSSGELSRKEAEIAAISDGGNYAFLVRLLLRMIVLRHQGTHLSFHGFRNESMRSYFSVFLTGIYATWLVSRNKLR